MASALCSLKFSVPKPYLIQAAAFVFSPVWRQPGKTQDVGQQGLVDSRDGTAAALSNRPSLCLQSFSLFLSPKDDLHFPDRSALTDYISSDFSSSPFIIYSISCNVASSVYYLQCGFQFSFGNFSSYTFSSLHFHFTLYMLFIIQYVVFVSFISFHLFIMDMYL